MTRALPFLVVVAGCAITSSCTTPRSDRATPVLVTEPPRITAEDIRSVRTPERREALLKEYYRRDDPVAHTDRALHWLINHQRPDGSWGTIPATALSVLSLLADLESAERAAAAKRGVRHLLGQQKESGLIGETRPANQPYEHALSTRALCEAYILTSDESLRLPAQRAVRYILDHQQSGGGWHFGYARGNRRETVLTVIHMEALFAAYTAGWFREEIATALSRAAQDLRSVQDPDTGRFGTFFRGVGGPGISGAAILGLQLAGQSDCAAVGKGLLDLEGAIAWDWSHTGSWYFYNSLQLHQALFNQGGLIWKYWREFILSSLLSHQQDDGSWFASGDEVRWGPAYATAACALMLQTVYRQPALRAYTTDQSTPPLWRIEGESGTTYLLASIPLRPHQTYLIGPQAERAFRPSDRILVESDPRAILYVLYERGVQPEGTRITWPNDIFAELQHLFRPARITREDFEAIKPWALALGLMGYGLDEVGATFEASAETYYRRHAGLERKGYHAIIAPEAYATWIDSLTPDVQIDLLRQVLAWIRQSPTAWHDHLVESWRTGRIDEMDRLIGILLGSENRPLAPWRAERVMQQIEHSLQSGETHLYVLNADVLMGPGGILDILNERGIGVTVPEPLLRQE